MFQEIKDINKWEKLLSRVSFKTFFHEPEWEGFLEKEFKWLCFRRFLYKDEALISLAEFKKFGKSYLVSHPFCEYGGVLPLKKGFDLENFMENFFKEFSEYKVKIKTHPFLDVILRAKPEEPQEISEVLRGVYPERSQGTQNDNVCFQSTSSSYWLNIKNRTEQEIFSCLRKTLRHSIKKAEESGIRVKRCGNLDELGKFYDIYAKVMKQKKTIPYPFAIFQYLYNNSNPANSYSNDTNKKPQIYLAYWKNKVIAGSIFLHYNGFVHYYLSATDFKFRAFCPNYLILWDKIKSSINNFEIFDFGGTGKGSSLEVFKKGWGAKEMPIISIANYETNFGKSKIKSIFSFIPTFLLKKLAAKMIKYRI